MRNESGMGGIHQSGTVGRPPSGRRERGVPGGRYMCEAHAPFCVLSKFKDFVRNLPVASAAILRNADLGLLARSHFEELCRLGPRERAGRIGQFIIGGGGLLWQAEIQNLIVDTGLDDYLERKWKASAYTSAHYLLMLSATPSPAAGDTMASHGGWTEVTGYDEASRQAITFGAVSAQSVDNSGSKAVITASGSITVGGCGATDSSTKGGSTGILTSAGAFTGGDQSLTIGSTLTITFTATMADDGV